MSTPGKNDGGRRSDASPDKSALEDDDDVPLPIAASVQPPASPAGESSQTKRDRVIQNLTLLMGNPSDNTKVLGQVEGDLSSPDNWDVETILEASEYMLDNISMIEKQQKTANAEKLVTTCVDRLSKILKNIKKDKQFVEDVGDRVGVFSTNLRVFSNNHKSNRDLQYSCTDFLDNVAIDFQVGAVPTAPKKRDDLKQEPEEETTPSAILNAQAVRLAQLRRASSEAQAPPFSAKQQLTVQQQAAAQQQQSPNNVATPKGVVVSDNDFQKLKGLLKTVSENLKIHIETKRTNEGGVYTTLPKDPQQLGQSLPQVIQAYKDSGLTALTPDASDIQTLELMAKTIYEKGCTIEKLGPKAEEVLKKEGITVEEFIADIAKTAQASQPQQQVKITSAAPEPSSGSAPKRSTH